MNRQSITCTIMLAALTSAAFGFGFRLGDQDAAATARGLAFAATADNPSAIFYNPAGITQLDGLTSRLGAYGINLESHYTSPDGDSYTSKDTLHAVPQTFVTYKNPDYPVAIGFGSYSPWGLSLKYRDNVPFRTISREGGITFMAFNPVIALQVSRTFSVGVGATINYAKAEFQRGILEPGDTFRFKGDGEAIGFNAGLLWQPTPQHSFGLRYHGATPLEFHGHSRAKLSDAQRAKIRTANKAIRSIKEQLAPYGQDAIDSTLASYGLPQDEIPDNYAEEDADVKIHFPQIVTFGYSFRPRPDWNIELDIDWTDWDSLDTATLHKSKTGDAAIPFNYQSSFIYCLGVTKEFSKGIHASCGYIYSESSISDANFSPGNPDGDRHVFSAGIGQKTSRFSWDLAYQYSYAPERKIHEGTPADGTYDFSTHAIALSLGLEL
jgi:long-chain fatty acid transport protein